MSVRVRHSAESRRSSFRHRSAAMTLESNDAPASHSFDPNASDLKALCALENHLASLTLDDLHQDDDNDNDADDKDGASFSNLQLVLACISSPDDGVRYHAIEAAGKLGVRDACPHILRCLRNGGDDSIDERVAAAKAGSRLAEQGAWSVPNDDNMDSLLNATFQLASHPTNRKARKTAVKACGVIFESRKKGRGGGKTGRAARKKKSEKASDSEGRAAKAIVQRLLDEDADVRIAAVSALTKLGTKTKSNASRLIRKLMISHPGQGAVCKALVALAAYDELERLEGHGDEAVRKAAKSALKDLEQEEEDDDAAVDDDDSGIGRANTEDDLSKEYDARILRAKKRLRPQQGPEWNDNGLRIERSLALQKAMDPDDVRDNLLRIDYDQCSPEEWDAKGYGLRPQVIKGATKTWPAKDWTEDTIRSKWGKKKFRVGSDENDQDVRLSLADFLTYHKANQDDNPMYMFEHIGEAPLDDLLKEYRIPKYFDKSRDLFSVLSDDERPPHRWMLYGGPRSGSAIHKDPLCTSAWNTSLFGRKRWLLFPPETRKIHLMPPSVEALWPARIAGPLAWFEYMLPRIRSDEWRGPQPIEILQEAGETVYVPNNYWHIVLNLEPAVAVTQNIGALHDLKSIEDVVRRKRPDIYDEWMARVQKRWTGASNV